MSVWRMCVPRVATAVAAAAAAGLFALAPGAVPAAATPRNVVPPQVLANPSLTILECDGGDWEFANGDFEFQWLRNGTAIPGASEVTYRVRSEDQGRSLSCVVIEPALLGEPRVEAESFNSVQIPGGSGGEPFKDITRPHVSGGEHVGEVLACSSGGWTDNPSLAYQWLRDGAKIERATGSEYLVTAEDEGHALSCAVTASHGGETITSQSDNSAQILVAKLEVLVEPEVIGVPEVGRKLTCSPGEWSGSPTFSYQWLRDGKPLPERAGYEYTVEAPDQLHELSCEVFAVTGGGQHQAATSRNRLRVSGSEPVNVAPPAIAVKGGGEAFAGRELVCEKDTWTGVPAPEYKFQWIRDGKESLGEPTSADEYTVQEADRGHTLACAVFARNEVREGVVALSNAVGVPKGSGLGRPANQQAPTVSPASAVSGQPLTCGEGSWSPAAESFGYRWLRDGKRIGGAAAQGQLYTVTSEDEGHSLSCEVTAINEEGSATAASSNAAKIAGSAPVNVVPPQVSGVGKIGETLVCLRGEWRGQPEPSYTFHWLRGTKVIATGSTYKIVEEDRGYPISCSVTAVNGQGPAAEKASSNSVLVPGVVPHDSSPPNVTGDARVGGELTCNHGEWTGAPEPSFAYQWTREGEPIPGATSPEYQVLSSDRGRSLACRVRGSNREGSETVWSTAVKIPGERPHDLIAPQLTGDPSLGQTLTCLPGVWDGHPPPVLSYQWLRGGVPILGSTSAGYRVSPGDQGQLLSCAVVATNNEGSSEAESNGVAVGFPSSSGQVAGVKSEQPFTPTQTAAVPLSLTEVLAALRTQLTPTQHTMKSHGLLRWGHYTFAFAAPASGTLRLTWYRASASGSATHKATVVAAASTSFPTPGTRLVTLRLSSEGRRLLKENKSLKVNVTATFVRATGLPASWTRTIYLTR